MKPEYIRLTYVNTDEHGTMHSWPLATVLPTRNDDWSDVRLEPFPENDTRGHHGRNLRIATHKAAKQITNTIEDLNLED